MLKTLLAATTALTLMSGIGFAETSYSSSTTESTAGAPHGADVSKTVRKTTDHDGMITEKDKTVRKDFDHDGAMDKTVHKDFDRDRTMAEKDKVIHKDTNVSADGTVSHDKSVTTTVR